MINNTITQPLFVAHETKRQQFFRRRRYLNYLFPSSGRRCLVCDQRRSTRERLRNYLSALVGITKESRSPLPTISGGQSEKIHHNIATRFPAAVGISIICFHPQAAGAWSATSADQHVATISLFLLA
jgi:hypothetical protein